MSLRKRVLALADAEDSDMPGQDSRPFALAVMRLTLEAAAQYVDAHNDGCECGFCDHDRRSAATIRQLGAE